MKQCDCPAFMFTKIEYEICTVKQTQLNKVTVKESSELYNS